MATPFDIDRFLNIRSALGPSFAPDGRFVSFLTNITGVSQLWQVPVSGGWPVQLTFTRETVHAGHYNRAHGWSPDDRWLLVSHDESSADQDLYVLDIENGKVRHLTPHRGRARYESPHWSADGRSIYCVSTAQERDLAGLARIDVA